MGRPASPARLFRFAPLLAAALLVVTGAHAEAAVRVGLSGFTGYHGYAMSDVNDVIASINDALSSPGDEVNLDELKGDVSFGAGVKFDLDPTWRVYAEYEHLSDNSGGGNLIGSAKIDVSSETFLVGATYFLPSKGKARVGFGGGVGYYDFGGNLEASGSYGGVPFSGSQSASGTTIGFHGRADLDWSGIMTRVGFTWFVK